MMLRGTFPFIKTGSRPLLTGKENVPYRRGMTDRSGGLVLAGVVEILIGGVLLLLVPLSIFGGSPATVDARSIVVSVCVYLALSVFFVITGTATLRRRRWARTLMQSVSGLWLIVGIFTFVVWLVMSPIVDRVIASGANADLPRGVATIAKLSISALLLVVYIALPAALFLFLRSPSVRATVERHDPNVPWTDRVSPPVLSMILTLVYLGATGLLFAPFGGAPFFGVVLGTGPSAVVWLVVAALCAALARGFYRGDLRACWGTIALTAVATFSAVVTFLRVDPAQMWSAFGIHDEHLELLGDAWLLGPAGMIWTAILSGASVVVYALHVRRTMLRQPGQIRD